MIARRFIGFVGLAVLLCLAADARAQNSPEAVSLRVQHVDGRLDTTITAERLAPPDEELFVAGSDLARILQAGRFWRQDVRKLVLRVEDQRITFTVGARSVVGGAETVLLRHEVRFHKGEPWIPLEFLTAVLPGMSDREVRYDADSLRLILGERDTNVLALAIDANAERTELRLTLEEPLAFRVDDRRSRQLVIKVYGGTLDPGQIRMDGVRGLVEGVESSQDEGFALVTVRLSELAESYQPLTERDGRVILLRIEPMPVTTIPEPTPRGPHLVQTLPPEARARKVVVRKVVIDPGHGGVDMGAIGRDDVREKDITLAVGRELASILRDRDDIQAVLTRNDDSSLGLVERTEFANREGADLFVSLHCNAWHDPRASGVETYFLAPAESEWGEGVAAKENAVVASTDDLDFILWDLVQNVYIQESATLAEAVQGRVSGDTGLDNRGVKQAGFRVLVGAFMPAILVEMGFLTNSGDARRLNDAGSQREIARAIADAIIEFRSRMDAVREETR